MARALWAGCGCSAARRSTFATLAGCRFPGENLSAQTTEPCAHCRSHPQRGLSTTHARFAGAEHELRPHHSPNRSTWGNLRDRPGSLALEQTEIFAVAVFCEVRPGDEPQRRRIDAVTLARGRGPIVEDVSQMRIRIPTAQLSAHRAPRAVHTGDHVS